MRYAWKAFAALALRRPLVVGIVAAFLIVGLGLAGSAPWLNGNRAFESAEEPDFHIEGPPAPGERGGAAASQPVADFTLTDQEGRRVSLQGHAGMVLLVNFVTSRCTAACIQVTRELQGLQKALGDRMGREVVFLSVGLDPRVDSRDALRKFAGDHGVDFRGWSFLTGTPEELEQARRAFGAVVMDLPAGADSALAFEHTAATYLVDRQGVLRKKIAPGLLTMVGLQEIATVAARPPKI